MEAGSIIKQFVKYWDKRLCRVQSVTSTKLSSVLMDMIDDHRPQSGSASASASAAAGVGRSVSAPRTPRRPQASAAGAGSSPAPRTPPRAMAATATPKRSPERRGYMAVAEKGDAAGHTTQDAHVTLSEGTGQDSFVEPSLPLVDPLKDNTSIYVMLDEGCNTTCHGKGWRLHAERILANTGCSSCRFPRPLVPSRVSVRRGRLGSGEFHLPRKWSPPVRCCTATWRAPSWTTTTRRAC